MSAVIVAYPPGAGGNHIKNLLCTYPGFGNSGDLNTKVYIEDTQPPGTVHSKPGRNVTTDLFETVEANPEKCYIIHGHFGELAPFRQQINRISKKFILIAFDNKIDQQLLDYRQGRLGHRQHPYYIEEEQPFLYRTELYTTYFTANTEDICVIPLYEIWHPDLNQHKIVERLNIFLNINMDHNQAQSIHDLWWKNNFNFDFCNFTRNVYGKTTF